MRPGMMPILHLPGEMMPGQLGPMRRVFLKSTTEATRTMSSTGMPSVMQTTSAGPASAASRMASAAYGGGTKITVALASGLGGLGHGIEDWTLEMLGSTFAGSDSADHV